MRLGPEPRMIDAGALGGPDLVLLLVGRVVVRRERLELGRAGVDRLEGRPHAVRQPGRPHVGLARAAQVGQLRVGEPEPLGPAAGRLDRAQVPPRSGAARPRCASSCADEPRVDAGAGHHLVDARTPAQGRLHLEDAVGRGHARSDRAAPSTGIAVERSLGRVGVEARPALLERAQRLLERLAEGAADGHDLAHRLHAGAQAPVGAGQLLEGPARDLGHDVVDGRLEARPASPW